jgi:hypothetical protein
MAFLHILGRCSTTWAIPPVPPCVNKKCIKLLRRLRQKDFKFDTSLGNTVRPEELRRTSWFSSCSLKNRGFIYFISLFILWYSGLSSKPIPSATPPAFFCDRVFFELGSHDLFALQTTIFLTSASWVARLTGVSHWHPARIVVLDVKSYPKKDVSVYWLWLL